MALSLSLSLYTVLWWHLNTSWYNNILPWNRIEFQHSSARDLVSTQLIHQGLESRLLKRVFPLCLYLVAFLSRWNKKINFRAENRSVFTAKTSSFYPLCKHILWFCFSDCAHVSIPGGEGHPQCRGRVHAGTLKTHEQGREWRCIQLRQELKKRSKILRFWR